MDFLNLIFPRRCIGCGSTGSYFCSLCLNRVSLKTERICPVCQKPSFGGQTHLQCRGPLQLDGLTTIFCYKGIVKIALKKLKYRFVTDISHELVELFLSFCGEDLVFSDLCREKGLLLAPIPLHPRKERWRGFNQAEILGKMIAERLGVYFLSDLLMRVRPTKPQFQQDKKERRKNLRSAFSVNTGFKELPKNSKIILFDDIWGSGATLSEAAKTLRRSGAKSVWGLTLVR